LVCVPKSMSIKEHFSGIRDKRYQPRVRHLLTDIVCLSIIGAIAGCESYNDIEDFGNEKADWLRKYLDLPHGIPSADTIQRLFEMIDSVEFHGCFRAWVQESFDLSEEQLIHIDGKANRRSGDKHKGQKMLHAVNVFAGKTHLSLAQMKVDEKSNEITAITPLLEVLDIQDKVVTIDAMGCQKEIAKAIKAKGGDYILAVKDNQKSLHEEIQSAFVSTAISSAKQTIEKGHGRIEERNCAVIDDLRFVDESINWTALCCIIRIISHRTIGDTTSTETRYFISSKKSNAVFFLHAIRSHWGIENCLHWVLDVLFHEDHCRKRKENAAENFNFIRKMALNFLRSYKGDKKSLRRRRLNAAWDTDYLEKILGF
jgi:predicted transposase YbfD/YdcC